MGFHIKPESGGAYSLYTMNGQNKYYFQVCGNSQASSYIRSQGWCEKFFLENNPLEPKRIKYDPYSPSIQTSNEISGMYVQSGGTKYYAKVCGSNQATSQTSNGGWCERFHLDPLADGTYGVYTKNGNTKYYLKVCGNGHATSQTSVGGWCEKFHVESRLDGSYSLYTRSGNTKYYFKVCGNGHATSQT